MDKTPDKYPDGALVRPNQHIMSRLDAMLKMLLEAHGGGGKLSAASKGNEREIFVTTCLSQAFPPHFRFGSGDITDSDEQKSGQIDVVIEYPNLYSFPIWQGAPRLYLAEGVAVVIEIKSDLSNQWAEVKETASKLKSLKRRFEDYRIREDADLFDSVGDNASRIRAFELREMADRMQVPKQDIPILVVGYKGWAKADTLMKHLKDSQVDAVLQLDNGFFCEREHGTKIDSMGPACLMMFLEFIRAYLNQNPPQSHMFNYAKMVDPEPDGQAAK